MGLVGWVYCLIGLVIRGLGIFLGSLDSLVLGFVVLVVGWILA